MNIATHAARYSRGAIALHWIMAALIVLNFVLAELAEDAAKEDRSILMGNHKAIGITILLLTLVRIGWRMARPAPPPAETLKAWEAALSKVVHGLFYVLMLAIPLAGWAASSAYGQGAPVDMFGLFGMPALPVEHGKEPAGLFGELHETTAKLMFVLFVLHVGAALKHRFIDRDATLRRMVPWLK
ncbi:MAG: cytochrome b [Sphingomonadaceae bacterium]|nr:cytochrome b [Sphingomonadaceae bacterium]